MPHVQASKGLFRKGSAPWDYAGRATLGKRERTCNMWPQLRPSISFDSSVGSMASLMLRPGSHRLPKCIVRLLKRGVKGVRHHYRGCVRTKYDGKARLPLYSFDELIGERLTTKENRGILLLKCKEAAIRARGTSMLL